MCGIVGIVRNDARAVDEMLLSRMCAAIRHRGPDEDGFYVRGPVGLAMRRLSIIDLKGGQQPIHNQDQTAWIVFNGEIYNYLELRQKLEKLGHTFYTNSDTEAIIHAYDRYGAECAKHLRGMFAFAIWDERSQELFLARDRVGKKPLLYAQVNGGLIFGSEFSALLLHPDISRDVEPEALDYYLSFMCVPAPLTAYKAIEQDFSELQHARRVAQHVGAEHHEFIVRPDAMEVLPILVEHYGEPYADSSAVPTYYVARETRKHVTVALNGDGGDETFAGYERYIAMGLAERYRKLPGFLRDYVINGAVGFIPTSEITRSRVRDAKRFLRAASLPKLERYLGWVSVFDTDAKRSLYSESFLQEMGTGHAGSLLAPWFARANGSGIVDATLLTDTMTYLPNDLLVKVDIATMAVSLEARSPFLDHHVIEFAASLPENLKLRGLTSKYLLKRVLRKLLPSENLDRKKMGFGVPIGHWFRGKMQPFLRETLLSDKALKRGLFNSETVKQLVDLHTRAERDYSHQLWTLLMLELWFQRFID